jgi:hypothetical protein
MPRESLYRSNHLPPHEIVINPYQIVFSRDDHKLAIRTHLEIKGFLVCDSILISYCIIRILHVF